MLYFKNKINKRLFRVDWIFGFVDTRGVVFRYIRKMYWKKKIFQLDNMIESQAVPMDDTGISGKKSGIFLPDF